MFGAGLIKIRGDPCWLSPQYSCMFYHYETQPVPNPLSPYLHILPQSFHRFETLFNHFIELLCPFLLLIPYSRSCRLIGALLQIFFQTLLIISGNLSFLNWLTILPCLTLLDDSFLSSFFPFSSKTLELVSYLQSLSPSPYSYFINLFRLQSQTSSHNSSILPTLSQISRYFVHLMLLCLLTYYSIPVVTNLISSQQVMNTSYDPFRILNTYGAFGSITKVRHEVILQGTYLEPYPTSSSLPPIWVDYEFLCKPGNINRRPCVITPYHYRLDWLMWFAGHYQSYQPIPWLVHLAVKLLEKDPKVWRIMDRSSNDEMERRLAEKYKERWLKSPVCVEKVCISPSVELQNITHIRAQLYEYQYASNKLLQKDEQDGWEEGVWWRRKELRSYLPVISLNDPSVLKYFEHHGWKSPTVRRKGE